MTRGSLEMRRPSTTRTLGSDRGAIVIQVAVALLAFTMMSAFVIDFGVQLVSRNQIQTAVDAAALAGATALAYDGYTEADRVDGGPVKTAAFEVAKRNLVWQQPADVVVGTDVTYPTCPDSFVNPGGVPIFACVQVSAYRNAERHNPLPAYISQLMSGVAAPGVAATATAEAKDANSTDCLKPLAIPDRWTEHFPVDGAWDSASTFRFWDTATPFPFTPYGNADSYNGPTPLAIGSGLTMADHFGAEVTLKVGGIGTPESPIAAWNFLPVEIPGSTFGATAVLNNTKSCAASKVGIGDRVNFPPGTAAANGTLALQGLEDLINRDPAAAWSAATRRVVNSCADALTGRCASMSPRVIAVGVFDPRDLANNSRSALPTSVRIRNIVGFFVEAVDIGNARATGRIVRHPGLIQPTATTLIDAASFLRASLLVN